MSLSPRTFAVSSCAIGLTRLFALIAENVKLRIHLPMEELDDALAVEASEIPSSMSSLLPVNDFS